MPVRFPAAHRRGRRVRQVSRLCSVGTHGPASVLLRAARGGPGYLSQLAAGVAGYQACAGDAVVRVVITLEIDSSTASTLGRWQLVADIFGH